MGRETTFRKRVRAVVAGIPRGQVLSYGEVARRAGFPGAARAVGSLMRKNRDPRVPCHRVIQSGGLPGAYSLGGTARKVRRLKREGVRFLGNRVDPSCIPREK